MEENENNAELAELQQRRQIEAVKKILFMRILDEKARERLNNIKYANPEFGSQLEAVLLQLVQSGQAKLITEATLITIINQLRPPKRETKIVRM